MLKQFLHNFKRISLVFFISLFTFVFFLGTSLALDKSSTEASKDTEILELILPLIPAIVKANKNNRAIEVTLSQDNIYVTEGDSKTYTLSFTGVTKEPYELDIEVIHRSAEDGDIASGTKTITIPDNTNEVSFSLNTIEDKILEKSERYWVQIKDIRHDHVNKKDSIGTYTVETHILDDDEDAVKFDLYDISNEYKDLDNNTTIFKIHRTGKSEVSDHVRLTLSADHNLATVTYSRDGGDSWSSFTSGYQFYFPESETTDDVLFKVILIERSSIENITVTIADPDNGSLGEHISVTVQASRP